MQWCSRAHDIVRPRTRHQSCSASWISVFTSVACDIGVIMISIVCPSVWPRYPGTSSISTAREIRRSAPRVSKLTCDGLQ